MGTTSDERLKEVLTYAEDYGDEKALEFFDIQPSTLRRHRRRARERGLEVGEEYDSPDILVYDVETAPLEAYVWDTGKQYVQHENIKKPRSLLSWSAKWLCESQVISEKATIDEAHERDDERLINGLWELLHEADIVLGHNVKKFDNKVANSRFLDNELEPPSPYQSIDTYRQARKNFDWTSNSLDYLSKKLCSESENKQDHNMDLWRRCVEGDESALRDMEKYNRADVRVVEDLHFKLRPYYTSSVNLGLYYDGDMSNRCPNCGSKDIELGENQYYTSTGRYKTTRCNNCGGLGRERFADISTEERRHLERTLAR